MTPRGTASRWLDQQWYTTEAPSRLLTGLETLYRRSIGLRREAYRTGRKLLWDPATNSFRNDSCPASELTRSYRGDWTV